MNKGPCPNRFIEYVKKNMVAENKITMGHYDDFPKTNIKKTKANIGIHGQTLTIHYKKYIHYKVRY